MNVRVKGFVSFFFEVLFTGMNLDEEELNFIGEVGSKLYWSVLVWNFLLLFSSLLIFVEIKNNGADTQQNYLFIDTTAFMEVSYIGCLEKG